ncbi:related to alpha-glucosidases, family 31 of glycosyl hydrolases [Ustilago trichophora]|uniref:Related to alpha-glucosidases, family 31 of glycosyl hydrolases n=1 Tax=Ustilago trichophora TaxID=86804 RepID=A0A5C3E0B9_9BASI|nr:related to alpha-glucosidases, family 31 of glycosyl hydrolases [Ustilago trichophora]
MLPSFKPAGLAMLALAWLSAATLAAQLPLIRSEPTSLTLSNGIIIAYNSSTGLVITNPTQHNETILRTPSTFLIASTGTPVISDSSGNFELTTNATNSSTFICGGPNATQSLQSLEKVSDTRAVLSGKLSSEACEAGWKLVISTIQGEAVRLSATITSTQGTEEKVKSVSLRYTSNSEEQFWGLGSQPSFMGLRGARVPIWTREGGVGRGDQPVTGYLNGNGSISGTFAGGSVLTTYTAIGSWTTTEGRWGVIRGPRLAVVDLDSGSFGTSFSDTAKSPVSASDLPKASSFGDGFVTITYDAPIVTLDLGCARPKSNEEPPLLSAITSLTSYTGRQPRLPTWTQAGSILGIQGGQTKVESIIRNATTLQRLPLAAVWLQDWCGTRLQPGAYDIPLSRLWWNWEPDQKLYPTWGDWVTHLNTSYGVRTLSYVNTFLANVSAKPTGFERNLYKEAVEGGRFVLNRTVLEESQGEERVPWTITSGPGIDAGLLDLSNETTRSWFKQLVKEQIFSANISGAMQDFGEYLSTASDVYISTSGNISSQELDLVGDDDVTKPTNFHNQYPTSWAQLLYEVSEDLNRTSEIVGFHRSASTFSAPHTNLFWVGDQNIDFSRHDGLRSVIPSTIHMGLSGFGISHSDIGGYTNTLSTNFNITRSKALLGRWGEVGAFTSAVFRTHEGNIPSVNQQAYSDDDTWAYHRHNTGLFVALAAYRKVLMEEYYDRGWPLVRPTELYAEAQQSADQDQSGNWTFFLGDKLFVAPIYDAENRVNLGEQNVTVTLPKLKYAQQEGVKYRHIWTNQTFAQGDVAQVKAAFGHIPAFIVDDGDKEDEIWTKLNSFVQESFAEENQLNLTSILAN